MKGIRPSSNAVSQFSTYHKPVSTHHPSQLLYPKGRTQDLINPLKPITRLILLPLSPLTLMEIHIILPAVLALIGVGETRIVGGGLEGDWGAGFVGLEDVVGG